MHECGPPFSFPGKTLLLADRTRAENVPWHILCSVPVIRDNITVFLWRNSYTGYNFQIQKKMRINGMISTLTYLEGKCYNQCRL